MNKIDVGPPLDVAGAGVSLPQPRRSPPKAARVLLPVWGYRYVRQFLECGLPTLLAPGNVPGLAAALPTEFVLLISADDQPFIAEHPAFRRLAESCDVTFHLIDHLITDGNYSTTITLAYTEAVRAVGDAMLDTCFFFLVSDYIMADGSLVNALKRMQGGASAVVVGNFQVALEEALPWLEDKLASAKGTLALPPRELMRWSLNHLHPTTLANTVNIPFSHNSHTNRLFWRVDLRTMLGRFYLMHMLCVRPEITDFVIGSSCDYSFVPEMCPSGNVEALTDSDEYLVIEMQPRNHEAAFLRPGPLTPRVLAKSLSEWTTSVHRDNARHCVVFHTGDLPTDMERNVAQCDAFIAEVGRALKSKPKPYRDHPYWHGAMAAFYDATGRKLSEEEWRYALGLPPGEDWLSRWLLWQAKYALLGRPPHVLPWHPNWPDYKAVLAELEPFFADQTQHMLILSNEPTVFTVALADSGERVHRLRCTPFLQSPAKRFKPLHEKFDLCLLELSEGDMAQGDMLMDRIVPLMKKGGRIIVSVMNRRGVATAHEFGNGVSYHGTRFLRAGVLPTSIQFIPASRLRWTANRGMGRLRGLAARNPVVGLPAVAVLGGMLLTASFVGNLDALRQSRRLAPRGIASSFLLCLGVDQYKSDDDIVSDAETPRAARARDFALGKPLLQPQIADDEHTREPQYDRCVEVKN